MTPEEERLYRLRMIRRGVVQGQITLDELAEIIARIAYLTRVGVSAGEILLRLQAMAPDLDWDRDPDWPHAKGTTEAEMKRQIHAHH